MTREEEIAQNLVKKCGSLAGKVAIPRDRRICVEADASDLTDLLEYAYKVMAFSSLSAITGLDEGERFGVVYHLARPDGIVLNIKISTPRERPVVQTVTYRFPGAEIYERELADLFGVNVEGLPKGTRYPLPDNWPPGQYPLRKDWKP